MSAAVLQVRALRAHLAHDGAAILLAGIDVDLAAGRVLAVVGPSGSGKSTLGLALLGEAAPGVVLTGSVQVRGAELLAVTPAQLASRRAGRVGHLPQHPGAALDPVRRVGPVLDELAAAHHPGDRTARRNAVTEALHHARLPTDRALTRRFPHQLSGGQQQRMALAQTLVTTPALVVLDEPTTGLDPATTTEVVDNLVRLAERGTALVVLTHDLATARALAHDVLVLDEGHAVEHGSVADVLGDPPPVSITRRPATTARAPGLVASGLRVLASDGTPLLDNVSLGVPPGACLAVVGRSGAGKTTLARCLAGLVAPRAGTVQVDGRRLAAALDDRDAPGRRLIQYVHQDARSSFLDHRPVLDQLVRPGVLLRGLSRQQAHAEAEQLLSELGVTPGTAARRPGGLSGGQLQRAAVARAMLAGPAVLVCDEVTSALDAGHRASLLTAIDQLRRDHDTTVVLVSHDFDLVAEVAETIAVIDHGRIVDTGPTADILDRLRAVTSSGTTTLLDNPG